MSHSSQETPDYGVLVCRSSLFTRPADGAQKRHYCGQCRNLSVSLEEFGLGASYCFEVGCARLSGEAALCSPSLSAPSTNKINSFLCSGKTSERC